MTVAVRTVAMLLACALLAACSDGDPSPAAGTPSAASPTRSTIPAAADTPTPTAPRSLPAGAAWQAGRGEVRPEVKQAAARYLETAGTWTDAEGGAADVAARVRTLGYGPAAAAGAAVLSHAADAAVLRVVYPQYGGLTRTAASVMVVAEQRLLHRGEIVTRRLAVDVRLDLRRNRSPVVTGIERPTAAGAARPVSAAARAVLADPDIVLTDTAVADVTEGRIDDSVLRLLRNLAAEHVLDVTVLRSGHPRNVFATDRTSNHTRGRAVDIWRVDGKPVADPATSRALLRAVMIAGGRAGATEVGGPFDVDGSGPGFFTDQVHRDHLHFGVSAGEKPARP